MSAELASTPIVLEGRGIAPVSIDGAMEPPSTMERKSNLLVPVLPSMGMFVSKGVRLGELADLIARMESEVPDIKDRLLRISGDLSVGSPVITEMHHRRQARALNGVYEGEVSDVEGLSPEQAGVISLLERWISQKVVRSSASYSIKGGGTVHKMNAATALGFGDGDLAEGQITLTSGGPRGAEELVDRFLQNSTPKGNSIYKVRLTGSQDWAVLRDNIQGTLRQNDNMYVELVVEDSARFDQEVRNEIIQMTQSGNVLVVDMISEPTVSSDSLLVAEGMMGAVIGIGAGADQETTGIAEVIMYEHVDLPEAYQLRTRGTPPTSQLELKAYLRELAPELENAFISLSTDDAPSSLLRSKPFAAHVSRMIGLSAAYRHAAEEYRKGGEGAAAAYERAGQLRYEMQSLTNMSFALLEQYFAQAYRDRMPVFYDGTRGAGVVAVDGATRGALNTIFRNADIDGYLTPKPNWPTDMTAPDTTEVVELSGCFDKRGALDADAFIAKVKEQLAARPGQRLALDMKLIGNPQGMADSPETIEAILDLLEEHDNLVIIEDIMYLTYPGVDSETGEERHVGTYLEKAIERGLGDRVYATFSASKDIWLAGVRTGFVMSEDRNFLNRVRDDRSQRSENWLSTAMIAQRLADPERYWQDVALVNADKENRLKIALEMLAEAGIDAVEPEVGYYLPYAQLRSFMEADDPEAEAHRWAKRYLIAVNAMKSFMGNISDPETIMVESGVRLSVGSNKADLVEGVTIEHIENAQPSEMAELLDYSKLKREIAAVILADMHASLAREGHSDAMKQVRDSKLCQKYLKQGLFTTDDLDLMDAIWDREIPGDPIYETTPGEAA